MIWFGYAVIVCGLGGATVFEVVYLFSLYIRNPDRDNLTPNKLVTEFFGQSSMWHGLSWRVVVFYLLSFCGFIAAGGVILVPPVGFWVLVLLVLVGLFFPILFVFLPAVCVFWTYKALTFAYRLTYWGRES